MTTFKNLAIGTKFIFEGEERFSGWARGPWVKRSARTYIHVDTPNPVVEVGSVKAKVILLDAYDPMQQLRYPAYEPDAIGPEVYAGWAPDAPTTPESMSVKIVND